MEEIAKPHAKTVAWSYDMEGHARQCVERYCGLANKKKVEQLHKVPSPCLDDHQFKEKEHESVGELSNICSQIVLKCLYLARIGRPDILWSVTKLAKQSQNGLRLETDVQQDWILTFITQMISDRIVLWVTRLSIADWVCFKTQTLQAMLRTRKQPSVRVLCIFGS